LGLTTLLRTLQCCMVQASTCYNVVVGLINKFNDMIFFYVSIQANLRVFRLITRMLKLTTI